jgi:hypothetical protein
MMTDAIYASIGLTIILMFVAVYHYLQGRSAGIVMVLESLKENEPVLYEKFIKNCEFKLNPLKDKLGE